MLPARNHAVVLVSKVHLPTLRAVAYAQATRPDTLTALTVNVDEADTRRIQAEWDRHDVGVPLTVIDSPYREITRPIIDFVKSLRRNSPRDVVTVFIPEYVVGRWWEHLLHNQSALRHQGPAAVRAGRDGDQRAVAARLAPPQRTSTGSTGRCAGRLPAVAAPGRRAARRPEAARAQAWTAPSTTGSRALPVELDVGPVAHGGHCVARAEQGQVVFVRHALPGERVRARGHRGAQGLPAGRRGGGAGGVAATG